MSKIQQNLFKVHTDGSSLGNPGPSGIGVVIERNDGLRIEVSQPLTLLSTNNIAEYAAIVLALLVVDIFDVDAVQVFSDSELVVNQLNGKFKVTNPDLQLFVDRVNELRDGIGHKKVEFFDIPREHNTRADELAKSASEKAKENFNG